MCASITLDPSSEFLYWRMNWHLEHHMFDSIPCYNLKKLHNTIAHDMPKVRAFFSAWKEMLEIKRQQQLDPNFEFDTPVPSATNIINGKNATLTEPIGDLAPTSLK